MCNRVLHPATRMMLWFLLMIAVQTLNGVALLAALVLTPLGGAKILRRGGQLAWRARWLLCSLLAVMAWGTAGEPLWPSNLAPTYEGLSEAFNHLGRLLLVLMTVAGLLETVPLPELLAGARRLGMPLRALGINPDRGIVRLALVLRYVETLPRPRDWRSLLDTQPTESEETIEVIDQPLRGLDYTVLLLGAATVAGLCII